jgi:ACS family glucarate transporter-like MFS transporter
MGNQIGAAITASLTPWIALHFGWTASFLTAAALCVVGSASWLIVDPTKSVAFSDVEVPAASLASSRSDQVT